MRYPFYDFMIYKIIFRYNKIKGVLKHRIKRSRMPCAIIMPESLTSSERLNMTLLSQGPVNDGASPIHCHELRFDFGKNKEEIR